MALRQTTANISSTPVAIANAKTGRSLNIQSVQLANGSSSAVAVDLKDGTTLIETVNVPPLGGVAVSLCNRNETGWILTAGNALNAVTEAAATGVSALVEFGRV